jgi:hypothetical protein
VKRGALSLAQRSTLAIRAGAPNSRRHTLLGRGHGYFVFLLPWDNSLSIERPLYFYATTSANLSTIMAHDSEMSKCWRLRSALLSLASVCLAGCSTEGAPSFDLFGAFFPAWLLCGVIGIAGAGAARIVFISSGLNNVLPYQLAVCTAIGVITALLFWLVGFGH